MPTFITEENINGFEELSKSILVHMIETGTLPPILGEPITVDEAKETMAGFWNRNRGAIAGSTVEMVFEAIRLAGLGQNEDPSTAEFEEMVQTLNPEQLAQLAEADADEMEAEKIKIIDGRRALLDDLQGTGMMLARGALASVFAAALGLS